MTDRDRYEYKTVIVDDAAGLNAMANYGWRVCAVLPYSDSMLSFRCLLERPLSRPEKRGAQDTP